MPDKNVLMHDGFESLRPGPLHEAVDGAFREMHAQPASPEDNMGGWSRRVGNWDLRPERMWELIETPRGRVLQSCLTATTYDNASLAKGDYDWRDVRVESTMTLLPPTEGWGGPAGVIFRFLDSQRYYAAVVDEDGQAKILKRVDAHWDVLAAAPVEAPPERELSIRVAARRARLQARIGNVTLSAEDGQYAAGCVGFIGARPARFGPIRVTALAGERQRLSALRRAKRARQRSSHFCY